MRGNNDIIGGRRGGKEVYKNSLVLLMGSEVSFLVYSMDRISVI